jgi:hypothetical protein
VLKLRQQPIAKIVFVCMLLRNAYVCLNGCQSTEYFCMLPPTLEHWLSQGPKAKVLPNNSMHYAVFMVFFANIIENS